MLTTILLLFALASQPAQQSGSEQPAARAGESPAADSQSATEPGGAPEKIDPLEQKVFNGLLNATTNRIYHRELTDDFTEQISGSEWWATFLGGALFVLGFMVRTFMEELPRTTSSEVNAPKGSSPEMAVDPAEGDAVKTAEPRWWRFLFDADSRRRTGNFTSKVLEIAGVAVLVFGPGGSTKYERSVVSQTVAAEAQWTALARDWQELLDRWDDSPADEVERDARKLRDRAESLNVLEVKPLPMLELRRLYNSAEDIASRELGSPKKKPEGEKIQEIRPVSVQAERRSQSGR